MVNNEANFIPISSRNSGNTAESINSYYTTYPGYPTYGSPSASAVITNPYSSSDSSTYYHGSIDPKIKPGPPTSYSSYPYHVSPGKLPCFHFHPTIFHQTPLHQVTDYIRCRVKPSLSVWEAINLNRIEK